MFTLDRWFTGPEQYTHTFDYRMEPALRLASFFLEEDCGLDYHAHFKFGERKKDGQGRYTM
jgi:hypothetical protein